MQTHTHIIPGILTHSCPLLSDTHSQGSKAQTPYMSKSSKAEDVKESIWHQVGCVISNKKYIEPQMKRNPPNCSGFPLPLPFTDLLTLNKDVIAGSQKQLFFFFVLFFFFFIFGICLALNCLISSHAIYCLFSSLSCPSFPTAPPK